MDNKNNNKSTSSSQNELILQALKAGARITPIDALNMFGCLRLSARIKDLKCRGFKIKNEWRTENGKRFAEYRLVCEATGNE